MTASAGRPDRPLRRDGLMASSWRFGVIAVRGFKPVQIKTLEQKDGREPRNTAGRRLRGKRAVRSAGELFKVVPGPFLGAITFHLPRGSEEVANPQLPYAPLHCATPRRFPRLPSSSCLAHARLCRCGRRIV